MDSKILAKLEQFLSLCFRSCSCKYEHVCVSVQKSFSTSTCILSPSASIYPYPFLLCQSKGHIFKHVFSLLWVNRLPEGVIFKDSTDTPPAYPRVNLLMFLHHHSQLFTVTLCPLTLLLLREEKEINGEREREEEEIMEKGRREIRISSSKLYLLLFGLLCLVHVEHLFLLIELLQCPE